MTKKEAKKRAYKAAGDILYETARASEIFEEKGIDDADVALLTQCVMDIAGLYEVPEFTRDQYDRLLRRGTMTR